MSEQHEHEPPAFTCPRCGRSSYHPVDVEQGYCGACHDWTGTPSLEERQRTPRGARVRLVSVSDPWTKMTPGTEGTVILVDDIGTVHVRWDDGHQLGLIPGHDRWEWID